MRSRLGKKLGKDSSIEIEMVLTRVNTISISIEELI